MAASDVLKKKIGRELREWIYLGVRTGMRRCRTEYRAIVATDPDRAILIMRRCLDLPRRARLRILDFINNFATRYPSEGVTGTEYLRQCLLLNNSATISELNTELTTMENGCITLRNHIIAGTRTWAQVVTIVENNTEDESIRWIFKIPTGELDIWGDSY